MLSRPYVKRLVSIATSFPDIPLPCPSTIRDSDPYLGAGNHHLNLAAGGADELLELGDDTGKETEAVVLGEGVEEVLDGLALDASGLDELGNDGGLVGGAQGRGGENGRELGVLLDEVGEGGDGLGGGIEARGLDGGSVLQRVNGAGRPVSRAKSSRLGVEMRD